MAGSTALANIHQQQQYEITHNVLEDAPAFRLNGGKSVFT